MKNKIFFDIDHAYRYLTESIISIKGKPVKIISIEKNNGEIDLVYMPLYFSKVNNRQYRLPISNIDIDMTPVRLGFVNSNILGMKNVVRTFRKPSRQWRIGLTPNNLLTIPDYPIDNRHNLLLSIGMYNTILNNYPTLEETLKKVKDRKISVAFSRNFCIMANGELEYININTPIGEVKRDSLKLFDYFTFLSEQLEQDCIL